MAQPYALRLTLALLEVDHAIDEIGTLVEENEVLQEEPCARNARRQRHSHGGCSGARRGAARYRYAVWLAAVPA
jgi:hypothetical protein